MYIKDGYTCKIHGYNKYLHSYRTHINMHIKLYTIYLRYSCDNAHYQRSDIQDNVTMQLWNSESNVRAEDLCFTILGLCSYGSVLYTTNEKYKNAN